MLFFKEFLLNEDRQFLGQKVGDILSASQELSHNAKVIGTKDLANFSDGIVSQIRSILRQTWPLEEVPNLKRLQRIAVALMKAIDQRSDLPETLRRVTNELKKLSQDLGSPIQKLVGTDDKDHPNKNVSKPVKKSGVNAMQGEPHGVPAPPNTGAEAPAPANFTGQPVQALGF